MKVKNIKDRISEIVDGVNLNIAKEYCQTYLDSVYEQNIYLGELNVNE